MNYMRQGIFPYHWSLTYSQSFRILCSIIYGDVRSRDKNQQKPIWNNPNFQEVYYNRKLLSSRYGADYVPGLVELIGMSVTHFR